MRSKSPSPERKEELPTISKPSATALENLAKIRAMYGGQTKMVIFFIILCYLIVLFF